MKNVISLLIDSLCWKATGTNSSVASPTPFLDSLLKESLTCTNIYAQGPYTDAASKAYYTGENTLDNFGYFFRLNSASNNHFSIFHENGYHTIGLFYPYYMYGSEIRNNIDEIYYTGNFVFQSEWGGLYQYYYEILKNRELSSNEIALLIRRLELTFDVWIGFYDDLLKRPRCGYLIKDLFSETDVQDSICFLREEYEKFLNNKADYIYHFLDSDTRKKFEKIDKIDIGKIVKRDFIKTYVYKKYKSFLRDAQNKNFFSNLKNGKLKAKQISNCFKLYFKTKDGNYLKPLKTRIESLFSFKNGVNSYTKEIWQYVPSTRKQLDFASEILHNNANHPFYLSIHTEDLHGDVSFFSYDISDTEEIDEEFGVLSDYLRTVRTHFKGNLLYLLSLRYVDYCIEKFVKKLKDLNLWENTVLIVTSDHGHPNVGYPIHNKGRQINCFFDENYHVPLVIHDKSMIQKKIDSYCNTKDILPTLLDWLNISTPSSMTGKSLLLKDRLFENFVITEYVGPGCPDMWTRKLWYSIRNKEILICVQASISEDIADDKIVEAYNLLRDPDCLFDVKAAISFEHFPKLFEALDKRHREVRNQTMIFMGDIV